MRILLVHNFYRSASPSGENRVFDIEKISLLNHGHDVKVLGRSSDEIRPGFWGSALTALSIPWNFYSAEAIRSVVDEFSPDVVHVHNTFPLISPSIFYAIGHRAAKVLTLHNYRLVCPAAIPLRSGNICTTCIDQKNVIPAVRHGCYRGSSIATIPVAANVALHRVLGTWEKKIDAFIALTNFQKKIMSASGLPEDKIHVKSNFYPGNPSVIPWGQRENSVIFVGRVSSEKGVSTLIAAWKSLGASAPILKIVGDGPLRIQLEKDSAGLNVIFLGLQSVEATQKMIARSKLLIIPSECYEGFPMVISEAFAYGVPVVASDLGPLPSIVSSCRAGVTFNARDSGGLANLIRVVWLEKGLLEDMSDNARSEFEARYTEDSNYSSLVKIYEDAMSINSSHD